MDERFALAGIKLYFVHEPSDDLKGEDLVCASRDNVLIETLKAGTLGLPLVPKPTYPVKHPSGVCEPVFLDPSIQGHLLTIMPNLLYVALAILHPPILLLTKMKRWYFNYESTRPKTISKTSSDKGDLDFLIFWLFENDMKINFDLYKGKEKPELLKFVRAYRDNIRDHMELMEALQGVLHEEDWDAIQVTPETSTSEAALPSEPAPRSASEFGLASESALPSELASETRIPFGPSPS
ncbi:hypothetical protein H1R20_g15729, partial [Candolleomyces eurysporus]